MHIKKNGCLIVSLDFELFWGVTDSRTIEKYGPDIIEGRKAIPRLLELFDKYGIHATWGTVGMLFAKDKEELACFLPEVKPDYENTRLSAYKHFETIGKNEDEDMLHYAPSVISEITKHNYQEIGSHTFCHYYCREKGQTYEAFEADTRSAKRIAEEIFNIDIKSFIFPRNLYNPEYLKALKNNNIFAVRGNQNHFAYDENTKLSRLVRLIDTYIPVCGFKSYNREDCCQDGIINLKSSVFLRKQNKLLSFLEPLKIYNIKSLMKVAAKKGKIFHIWWHPHNMGENPDAFLAQVEELLKYYKQLNEKFGFESKNMGEMAEEIIDEENSYAM